MNSLSNVIIYRRYKVLQDKLPKKYATEGNQFIEEDYLISFSLKYLIRQRRQRDKIVKKARKLISSKGKIKAKNSADPKFYISEVSYTSANGEAVETRKEINQDLVEEQQALDGYYCVATNLYDDENDVIIDAMRYRWFIEDSFRIMKQEFNFRPVHHSKQERITCHFFTCFLSLLTYRYIQKYCRESKLESIKDITDERILETLREYNLCRIKKDFLVPAYQYNETVKGFESLFNVNLSKEIVTPSRIQKELKKQIMKH